MGYMSELLGLLPPASTPTVEAMPNASSMHAKLVKADTHGSILTGTRPRYQFRIHSQVSLLQSTTEQKSLFGRVVWHRNPRNRERL